MRDLTYSLKNLTARNKDGSFSTQANRKSMLFLFSKQLRELGFKQMKDAQELKGRHVNALVGRWQKEEVSDGTMKNRMSTLRWWAEKVGKQSIIARNNAEYAIENRIHVTNVSKAMALDREKLHQILNEHVKLSLELQVAFGLRREESIKFQASYADKGDHIQLKSSWTKGGKERSVPIRNNHQRELLDRVAKLTRKSSLIPPEKSYLQQKNVFERQTNNAGIHKVHGLRHQYAQTRYQELTGRLAPAAGGKTSKELTSEEKNQDHQVRVQISRELGHEREQITAVYLGR